MSAQPDGTAPQPPSGGGSQNLQATFAKANEQTRARSPFMFLVIGLCFFLPFVSISCSGQRIATLSGIGLATGEDVKVDESFMEELEELEGLGTTTDSEADAAAPETEENDPSLWAIIALAGAGLGVIVGFVMRGRPRSIGSLLATLVGLAGLIGLRFDLEGDISEGEGLVAIDYRAGYWITALLFVVLAIAHGSWLRAVRRTGPSSTGPPGPAP